LNLDTAGVWRKLQKSKNVFLELASGIVKLL
jgi:hypothetical protein